ncbi:MAG TPA: PDZ domain-containing protein [Bacteroidia bacterium]|jgi:pimeloyl-ACP methyl ester carboxylesterase|nr:PDZ domain-containing protein [Bacteroidia bacterium]
MKSTLVISLFLFGIICKAQELARRPLLGIQMEQITEDVKRIMELSSLKGVLIKGVISNTTATQAGFKKGDVLLKINGKEVNTTTETMKLISTYKGGDEFTYEIIRDKKIIQGKSVFKALPFEEYTDIDMQYTATETVNGIQRIILSKPKNKVKVPAIVFIGGIGCYSLDTPLDTNKSETKLLNTLTRAGYVCIRAEKPGVGDNMNCKPCNEISFNEELNGYVNVIKAIKKYDYVDSNQIYIIGHSMGGVMAPLIAKQSNIKGIIAYGTIGSNFIEYLAKTRRTIGEAYKWNPDETDAYIKEYCECAFYYFVEKMTTSEAAAKKETCKDYLSIFDYRSRKYNNELYELNIPGAWKSFAGKALLMWGESDYISSKEDHQIITQTINTYHPGNAEFVTVKATEHGMKDAITFQQAQTAPGSYNPVVAAQILQWLAQS